MSGERAALESGLSGQYVLEQELGHGGMATVYLARDLKHKRPVALKVLRREIAATLGAERFRREIETAARLQHPHILTVHDSGESGGYLWFTMPYVRGESLRDRLRREGRLPIEEAVRVTGEAAQALQYAHAEGVVHRDIKPENILLTADGSTLVADFGIARAVAGTAGYTQQLTETGLALGTPAYMAPEQALGDRQVDQRADQYALAVTCYEMLTGVPPFTGPTPAALIAKRFTEGSLPTVSRERPGVPSHIDAALQRALALKPDDRFGSIKEFHRALTNTGGLQPPITMPARSSRPRRLGNRRIAALVALASVLSVALLAEWSSGRDDKAGSETGRGTANAGTTAGAVVAVMEFEAPGDGGYVGHAFAGELARRLSQVNSIRVLGPGATGPYRAGADRLERLARDLRVTNVLEGAARPTGDRVALDLRLVAVPSGRVLWSFSEEHSGSDLAVLGGQLAKEVVTVIRAPIGATELGRVERLPTASPGAYSSFLRASALDDGNRAQNEVGMDLLREAIRQDSSFALAWATLARRFITHAFFVSMSYRDSGLAAARLALKLNPELDEAHFVHGDLLLLSGRPATARYSYLKAIELNPSHAGAMADLSDAEATTGRFDESLYWGLRGLALYPNAPPLYSHVSVPLIQLGDDAAAIRWLEAGVRRWPKFGRLQAGLAILELKQGRDSAALARLRRQASVWPDDEEIRVNLAQTAWLAEAPDGDSLALDHYLAAPEARPYGMVPYTFRTLVAATRLRQGDARRGRALADTALRAAKLEFENGGEDPNPAVEMAALLALMGRKQESLDWLERAHQAGYRDYRWPPRDPFLRALTGDARFARLLAQMESEVSVMRRRAAAANDSLFQASAT